MKKSLISALSILTAIGSLSPTVSIPSAHAETKAVAAWDQGEISLAIEDLLAAVQTARQTIRSYSTPTRPGSPSRNQRLNGKLENLENTVANIRNTSDRREGDRELSRKLEDLKITFLSTATEFAISTVAFIPTVQAAWYEIPMKMGALEQAVYSSHPRHPGPTDPRDPRDPRNPGHGRISFEFRGTVKDSPVYFVGNTAEEFKSNCSAFVNSARIQYVTTMTGAGGKSIADTNQYLNADQICAVALLNANIPGYETYGVTEMTMKGVHVAINNVFSDAEVADLVGNSGFGFQYVTDLSVRGRSYSFNQYLSVPGQKAIIRYNIARQAPVMKTGMIKDLPFAFSGYSAADVQAQCLDFWAQTTPQYVTSVTVNGREYNSNQYQNAQQACMTVMAAQ